MKLERPGIKLDNINKKNNTRKREKAEMKNQDI